MNDNKDIMCNSELIVVQTFMPKGPLYRLLKPVPQKLTSPFVQVFKLYDAFETTQNRLFLQKVVENSTVNSNLKNKVIFDMS